MKKISDINQTPHTSKKRGIKPESAVNNTCDDVIISGKSKHKMVKGMILPQDPLVDKTPTIVEVEKDKMGEMLYGERFEISDAGRINAHLTKKGDFIFKPGTPEFDEVNAFLVAQKTLDLFESYIGHKIDWAQKETPLRIYIHDKSFFNRTGYCKEAHLISLNDTSYQQQGKTVANCLSADAISHEVGHAILAGIRPNFWEKNKTAETEAFNEAFADSTSLLFNLSIDANLEKIISETGGDLSKNSRLSAIGEEAGLTAHLYNNDTSDDSDAFIRNLNNELTYLRIDELPQKAEKDGLSSEIHSFSRVFSGAFYDCIRNIYEKNKNILLKGKENIKEDEKKSIMVSALKNTAGTIGRIFARSIEFTPLDNINFPTAAQCIIKADEEINKGANREELTQAFNKHQISLK